MRRSHALRVLLAVAIASVAFGLRFRAAERLPFDYDEGWYVEAAEVFAEALRSGDVSALGSMNPRSEHPQVAKLVLAIPNLVASEPPSMRPASDPSAPARSRSRIASALGGALEVLLLALIQPLAGLLLAIHLLTIKYTSLAMLEAPPALFSLAAVACYARFVRSGRNGWLVGSAVMLGMTAASKYVYSLVGVVILIDWCLRLRETSGSTLTRVLPPLLWGTGSLLVFFAAYPYLWADPLWRLRESLFFHADFMSSDLVQSMGYPFWQPLVWLGAHFRADAPTADAYLLRVDPVIAVLALFGFDRLWRQERVYALWLGGALAFLLVWSTKWPHYVLILSAPLCLSAAQGAQRLLDVLGSRLRAWR